MNNPVNPLEEKEPENTFNETEDDDWDKYKDDKVAAKPRISISDNVCTACES